MATVFSKVYPPANRVETGLGVIEIEIVGRDGRVKMDPNGAARLGYQGLLPVTEPVKPSVLSGEPGFLFRTGDGIEVALSEGELVRLLRHELMPAEVLELHRLYGAFFETHDDFYDEKTGAALQRMSDRT